MYYFLVPLTLLAILPIFGQQSDPQTVYEEFKVSVHQLHVNVRDAKGNPVRGLTKEDFEIKLNGKVQSIESVFEINLIRDVLEADIDSIKKGEEEASETNAIPEHGRRMFVLLFDLQYSSRRGLYHAREAARRFVENDMLDTDLASVFTLSREYVNMAVNFTSDKEQLDVAIQTLGSAGKDSQYASTSGYLNPSTLEELRRSRFQNRSELDDLGAILDLSGEEVADSIGALAGAITRRRAGLAMRYMDRFKELGKALSVIKGRKNLMYFSPGFDINIAVGRDGNAYLLRIINELIDNLRGSGTVVFAVDTSRQGLAASKSGLDVLNTVASDSGGRVYTNYNRFDRPVQKVESITSDYYLVNVRSDLDLPKGELADVKVEVNRPGVKIFAPKGLLLEPDYENSSELERKLLLSEFIGKDQIALPIPLELSAIQIPGLDEEDRISLAVNTSVDGNYIFDQTAMGRPVELEIYNLIINRENRSLVTESFQAFSLRPEAFRSGVRPLEYMADFNLPPGRYKIKSLVRDLRAGVIACMIKDVDLYSPDLTISRPLAVNTKPALVMRAGDSHNPEPEPYPFQMGDNQVLPLVNTEFDLTSPAPVFYLIDSRALDAANDRLVVKAMISDDEQNLITIPNNLLKSRLVKREGHSAVLLLSIDLASFNLETEKPYQLLSSISLGRQQPVRGTLDFQVVSNQNIR